MKKLAATLITFLAVAACMPADDLASPTLLAAEAIEEIVAPELPPTVENPNDWFQSVDSIKELQRSVGVTADGIFGKGTLNAVTERYDLHPDDVHTLTAMISPVGPGTRVAGYDIPTTADPYAVMSILQVFEPKDWHVALRIAECESKLGMMREGMWSNSDGTHDYGIFQINNDATGQRVFRHFNGRSASAGELRTWLLNDYNNVRGAKYILDSFGLGWQPWVCAYNAGITDGLWSLTRVSDWCQYKGGGQLSNCK